LTHLSTDVVLVSFWPESFVGIGVPIATDIFVRNFVTKTCRNIIDDVEKLDAIQDGFVHYQLLRFCQVTRLQYINSHIMINNRFVLQQQDVDCKIPDAFLKKGTEKHTDGWDSSQSLGRTGRTWSSIGRTLRGVLVWLFTDVFYTTTSHFVTWIGAFSQERQELCLPKDDLRDRPFPSLSAWHWHTNFFFLEFIMNR
jgi:hypothetical protein